MRIGEISHVLDYRSQQVESTFLFDNQVSVTSAGAPEHQSTISIAAEYKIRSSILKYLQFTFRNDGNIVSSREKCTIITYKTHISIIKK